MMIYERRIVCEACNGTGYYDNTGSSKCGFCQGFGVFSELIPEVIPEEKKPVEEPKEPDEAYEDDPGDEPEDESD